jgi:hypothetical protein
MKLFKVSLLQASELLIAAGICIFEHRRNLNFLNAAANLNLKPSEII